MYALLTAVPELLGSGYLESRSNLYAADVPAEMAVANKAHEALDGWPGAKPVDLVESLLAVLVASARSEPDPAKKRKLERVAETIKELGVSTASDVIAKVLLGG